MQLMVLWAVVVLAVGVMGVQGAPSPLGEEESQASLAIFRRSLYGSERRRADSQCSNDPEKQYLCEMCAKETKSLRVYTLCCNGSDNAHTWCKSFLVYGINSV